MITKKQYVEYLVSTPKNCTCTYLAEHLEEVSHDVVNDFLHQKRFLPREVWKLVKDRIADSKEAFLLVDDSVQDKRYSRFIELVGAQYSGNEHRVIKGIGVVNLVHSTGKDGDFYPIDYRVYAPDVDGKTKNDHLQEMFVNALDRKRVHLQVLDQQINTQTATGRLLFNMLGAIAQFETELRAERQLDGIKKARERGVHFGRSKQLTQAQMLTLQRKRKQGVLIKTLMQEFALSKASVYRYLREPVPSSPGKHA